MVVGSGRVIVDEPMEQLIARTSGRTVEVTTPGAGVLADALVRAGRGVTQVDQQRLVVRDVGAAEVGETAREHGLALHRLVESRRNLEDVFMELTADATTYHASGGTP